MSETWVKLPIHLRVHPETHDCRVALSAQLSRRWEGQLLCCRLTPALPEESG